MSTRVYVAVDLDRTDDEGGKNPPTEAIRDELEVLLESTTLEVERRFTFSARVVGIGASHTALDESLRLRRQT